MRKYLLIAAILVAAAGAANAQTNVTIGGVIDGGIGFRTGATANNATSWGLQSGSVQTSQLVFKGTEDLGGGLSSYFYLASGFLIGNGASTNARLPATSGSFLFDRGSWLGLKGSLGSVQVGRSFTPFADVLYQSDASGYANFASLSNTLYQNQTGITGAQYTWANNAIKYMTPSFSGLSGEALLSMGGVAGDAAAGRQLGAAVFYTAGPFALNGAYLNANNPGGALGDQMVARSFTVSGVYNADTFKVSLNAANFKDPQIGSNQTFYSAGGTYHLTSTTDFVGDYTFLADKQADHDGSFFKLGLHHYLSKRTDIYVEAGQSRNHALGQVGLASVFPSTPGLNQVGVMMGMRQTF